jgi:hypothetical protein
MHSVNHAGCQSCPSCCGRRGSYRRLASKNGVEQNTDDLRDGADELQSALAGEMDSVGLGRDLPEQHR